MPRNSDINHDWTKHSLKFEARIAEVPPGGSLYETFRDAFKRQRVGQPSMTIKENHGGTHIHYKLNRCISTREMARLQAFPDEFIFKGTYKEGFKQVGNAVPPLLANHVALAVMESIKKIDNDENLSNK
jgi:Site-specific DNA methylase